jgi:hypothetical protein
MNAQIVRSGTCRKSQSITKYRGELANIRPVERIHQAVRCDASNGCAWRTARGIYQACRGCHAKKGCTKRRQSCHAWPEVRAPDRGRAASNIGSADLQSISNELAKYRAVANHFEEFIAGCVVNGEGTNLPITEPRAGRPDQVNRKCNDWISQAKRIVAWAERHLSTNYGRSRKKN